MGRCGTTSLAAFVIFGKAHVPGPRILPTENFAPLTYLPMYMKAQAGRFSKARETLKTLATTQLHPRRGMGNSHVATVHTAVEKTRDQADTQTPGQAMCSACSSTLYVNTEFFGSFRNRPQQLLLWGRRPDIRKGHPCHPQGLKFNMTKYYFEHFPHV